MWCRGRVRNASGLALPASPHPSKTPEAFKWPSNGLQKPLKNVLKGLWEAKVGALRLPACPLRTHEASRRQKAFERPLKGFAKKILLRDQIGSTRIPY